MRALIYVRVSTDAQERDGTSLDTQEAACRRFAHEAGWAVRDVIRDTASGASLDRPGMERLRALLRRGDVDVVLAYAVDRLSHNQNQIGVLCDEAEQAGARLDFVTESFEDTAVGRFILAARAFVAEVEREKIAKRTQDGKTMRARAGKLPQATGKGIYDYRYDKDAGRRAVVPAQAAVVQDIFESFAGGEAIVAIANRLNTAGIPAFAGGPWYSATVYHLLQNETYTSRTVYRRTRAEKVRDPQTGRRRRRVMERPEQEQIEIAGATPAIISRETFAAVQCRLQDPERLRQGKRRYDYGLSGPVACLACGRAMVGQTLQKRYRYYRCRAAFAGAKHERCSTDYVRADDLERAVREEVANVLATPAMFRREYQLWQTGDDDGGARRTDLERRIAELDQQKARLAKLYQLGEVDDAYFTEEAGALRARRTALDAQRRALTPGPVIPPLGDIAAACQKVRAWIAAASIDDLSLIARALQLRVRATKRQGELIGVIPAYAPSCSDADVRAVVGSIVRVPFAFDFAG